MAPLVDEELKKVDRRLASLDSLSSKLVEAMNTYYSLMQNAAPPANPMPPVNQQWNGNVAPSINPPVYGQVANSSVPNPWDPQQQQPQQQAQAGPLGYFKNTEPLLSSKLTPKLPSIFLLPIKLFSTATKPLNMLIGRGKKGGKAKSISLFSKRPISQGNNNLQSNQHVLPLVNNAQAQSFVLLSENIANGKLINDGQNQPGQSVYMFVPKNQPIESAHHHAAPAHAAVSSSPSGSFVNSHASLPSGFISNLPSEFMKDDNNSTHFADASATVDAKDAMIIDESQAKNRIPFKSHLHL